MSLQQPQVFNLFDGTDASPSPFGASFGQPVPANTRRAQPAPRNIVPVSVNPIPGDVFGGLAPESSSASSVASQKPPTQLNGHQQSSKGSSVPLAQNLFSASPGPNSDSFFDQLLPAVQTPTKFVDANTKGTISGANGSALNGAQTAAEVKTPVRRPPTAISAVSTPNPVTPIISGSSSAPKAVEKPISASNGAAGTPKSGVKVAVPISTSATKPPAKATATSGALTAAGSKISVTTASQTKVSATPTRPTAAPVASAKKVAVAAPKLSEESDDDDEDDEDDDEDESEDEESEEDEESDEEESDEDDEEEDDESDDEDEEEDDESDEDEEEDSPVKAKPVAVKPQQPAKIVAASPAAAKKVSAAPVPTPGASKVSGVSTAVASTAKVAPGTPKAATSLPSSKAITTPTRPPGASGANGGLSNRTPVVEPVKFAVPTAPARAVASTPKVAGPPSIASTPVTPVTPVAAAVATPTQSAPPVAPAPAPAPVVAPRRQSVGSAASAAAPVVAAVVAPVVDATPKEEPKKREETAPSVFVPAAPESSAAAPAPAKKSNSSQKRAAIVPPSAVAPVVAFVPAAPQDSNPAPAPAPVASSQKKAAVKPVAVAPVVPVVPPVASTPAAVTSEINAAPPVAVDSAATTAAPPPTATSGVPAAQQRRKPNKAAVSVPSVMPSAFVPAGTPTSIAPAVSAASAMPSVTLAAVSNSSKHDIAPVRPLPLEELQRPKPLVFMGFGGKLVTCIPRSKHVFNASSQKAPGAIEVRVLHEMLHQSDSDVPALRSYPGPLSHSTPAVNKNDVLKMLDARISALPERDASDQAEKLLWSTMRILLRHGGTLSTDAAAAELKQLLTPSFNGSGQSDSNQLSWIGPQKSPSEMSAAVSAIQAFLVDGKREEALAAAASHQLWAHALLISSLFGPEKYNDTISSFVKSTLPEGSPMRMLFLLLAGRPQDAFGSGSSSSGDSALIGNKWRENLVMILGNRSRSSNDAHILVALGDALRDHPSLIAASHLCYLLSQVDSAKATLLEEIADPAARLVLLGADHRSRPETYAQQVSSLQLSELYEYSKRLAAPGFLVPQLQIYKFIYACRLAEIGLNHRAWRYIESIKEGIKEQKGSYKYPRMFAHQFSELAGRLEQIVTKTAPTKGKLEAASSKIFSVFGKALSKGLGAIIGDDADDEDSGKQKSQSSSVQPSSAAAAPGVISPPAIPFVDPKAKHVPAAPMPDPLVAPGPSASAPLAFHPTVSQPIAAPVPNVAAVVPPLASGAALATSDTPAIAVAPIPFGLPSTPVSAGVRRTGKASSKRAAAVAPVTTVGVPAVSSGPPVPVLSPMPMAPQPSTAPTPIPASPSIPFQEAPQPSGPVPRVIDPAPAPTVSEAPKNSKAGPDSSADGFKVPKPATKQPKATPAPQPTSEPLPRRDTKKQENNDSDGEEEDDSSFKTPAKTNKKPTQPAASASKAEQPSTPSTPGRLAFLNPLNWFSRSATKPKAGEKQPVEVKLGVKMSRYYNEELKMWINPGEEEEARKKKAAMTAAPPVSKKVAASAPVTPAGSAPSTPSQAHANGAAPDTPGDAGNSPTSLTTAGRGTGRASRTAGGRGRKYVGSNNEIIETAKTPQQSAPSSGPQPTPIPFPRISGDSPLVSVSAASPLVAVPAGGSAFMPGAMSFDAFNAIAAAREAEAQREQEEAAKAPQKKDSSSKNQKVAPAGKKKASADDDGDYDIFNSKPKKKEPASPSSPAPKDAKSSKSAGNQKKKEVEKSPEPEAPLADDAEDDSDQLML